MSITITCEFQDPYQARQAVDRLRRRGYTVSRTQRPWAPLGDSPLLVAYPYGGYGTNTFGNRLLGGLPPMAGNGVLTPARKPLVSVLTDDTQTAGARSLLESLGGRIL